jgi:holo-[acyl-carrier protein] synthase
MLIGLGTDIIEISRVKALFERYGDRFLHRWFSDEEIAYCARKTHPERYLAARLAAKEACAKALRIPAGSPFRWKDMMIGHGESGEPVLTLRGKPRLLADQRGVSLLHLSIAHSDAYAVATVVAEA